MVYTSLSSNTEIPQLVSKIQEQEGKYTANGAGKDYVSYITLNTPLNERNLTKEDVMARDNRNIVIQENTVLIIGTFTSICLLIFGVYISTKK